MAQVRSDIERRYVRPLDIVKMTGLSKSAVMAALWNGQLRAFRHGRAWLIPMEAIDEWIEGKEYSDSAA